MELPSFILVGSQKRKTKNPDYEYCQEAQQALR
jgi:hypothetical protein